MPFYADPDFPQLPADLEYLKGETNSIGQALLMNGEKHEQEYDYLHLHLEQTSGEKL